MNSENSSINLNSDGEISALIETLLGAERRLEELTGGEVDTVAGADGRPFFLRRAQDQSRYQDAARQADILNALPSSIGLLDAHGVVVSVNEAWKVYHGRGEGPHRRYEVGSNYLDVCDEICGTPLARANGLSEALRSVLDGRQKHFSIEYERAFDDGRRWFVLTVAPLTGGFANGVIVRHTDITERKDSEHALRTSESRFRSLFDHMIEGYAYCRAIFEGDQLDDFEYLLVNDAFESITGLKPWVGAKITDLIPGIRQSNPEVFQMYGRVVVTGKPEKMEANIEGIGWLAIAAYRPEEGHFVAMSSNITDRKKHEEEIEAALRRLNEAQRIGQIGDWEMDNVTGELLWSPQVFEIFGRDPQLGPPLSLDDFAATLEPKSGLALAEQISSLHTTGEAHDVELKGIRPNGQPFSVLGRARARRDRNGRISTLYGTVQDVTERKQAEMLLRKSQQSLLLATESLRLGIWDWDVPTNKMEWDARMLELYGVRRQDFTGASDAWLRGLHPEDRAREQASLNAALAGDEGFDTEFRVVWPSGEIRHIEAHGVVLKAEDGSPLRMIGVNWDITERKGAETALRESEERFRKMLENVELLAMTLDTDGNVTFCNDHLLRLSGWNREEVLGTEWYSRFTSEPDRPALRDLFASILHRGVSIQVECQFVTKSGQSRQIAWNVAVLRDASARVLGIAGIGEDVTARKSLQEQLLQSQKMESLGSLAGGIAHDFNNLLFGILGYAELARMTLSADSPIQQDLEEIRVSANRAATLTRQLLAFARKEVVDPKVVDLGVLAGGLENLIRRLIGVDIELIVRSSPDLDRVRLDPSQFEQVLVNLAVNARDAMPDGGTLTVDLANRRLNGGHEISDGGIEDGDYVALTVTDTGIGMTKEIRERVFDPFFTTKDQGKGTGLGLSTCYGIVTNCGGRIWATSEIGTGTAFHVYFPRVDEPLHLEEPVEQSMAVGSGETILVVDDDDMVRTLAVKILASAGYRVLQAADGKAATGLAAEYQDEIDLMLTDVLMPGMKGPALADVIRLLKPEMKIIFMSGFADDAISYADGTARHTSFLQKPFSTAHLAQKVREVLDGKLDSL